MKIHAVLGCIERLGYTHRMKKVSASVWVRPGFSHHVKLCGYQKRACPANFVSHLLGFMSWIRTHKAFVG